jgi:hypothetical protein
MAPGHRWRRIVWTFAALVVLVGVVLWEPWRDHPQPGGLDPRTLEGIVEIAKSGPEVRGSLAAYWKGELNDADPPIALKRPKAFMPYQVPEYPESACTWASTTATTPPTARSTRGSPGMRTGSRSSTG